MRREWIEISAVRRYGSKLTASPSMRREWIEIFPEITVATVVKVSLHAEGVD